MTREHAYKLRNLLHKASASLDDTDALEAIELFANWAADTDYAVDVRVRYADHLYRCVQAHHSQTDWTPDATPALWAEVARPGEIPVWKKPTGAQDAYMKGDKVHYPDADSFIYESIIDNNVWSPDEYPDGWEKEL